MELYVKELPKKCSECKLRIAIKGSPIMGFCDDRECRSPECEIVGYDYSYKCSLNTQTSKDGVRPEECQLKKLTPAIIEEIIYE